MARKHTPGPWSADYGDFGCYADTGAEVAQAIHGNHDNGGRIGSPEVEANLKLIAAAPELLNALEVMVASFAGAMGLDENDLDADGESYDCVKQARAAIRSAKIWES